MEKENKLERESKKGSILYLFRKSNGRRAGKSPIVEQDCIRCGRCLEVCTSHINPAMLASYAKAGRYDDCQKYYIDYCTDCGNCTYVCPAKIPLFQYLRIAKVLSYYRGNKSGLVPVLLEVQANIGYLPRETVLLIADYLNIPEGQVYSVASFYKKLRLEPLGRQRITVCRGTACHVRSGPHILQELEKVLGIKDGETSPDMEYSLDTVACFGCCALAPCIMVNNNVYGNMTPEKVRKLFPSNGGKQDA